MSILDQLCVSAQHSMLEVMARVNENEQGIALVVDSERHLLDTITDGYTQNYASRHHAASFFAAHTFTG